MFAMIVFGYAVGLIPAVIAAAALSVIARRVRVTPHLVILSPLVGFGAMMPQTIWGALERRHGADLIHHIANVAFLGSIGAVAALGCVLLAWAFGCVPSPVTKLKNLR
jgi:uncharacterized membrane protein